MKTKKIAIVFIFTLIFIYISTFFTPAKKISGVELGGKVFSVEIADTDALRTLGLSGHVPLLDNHGMLFIFDKPDIHTFWMKDMLFPIDIIWIDKNLRIVYIEKNALPESYPNAFYPTEKSLYVLEISAGQADYLHAKIGDSLKFLKIDLK